MKPTICLCVMVKNEAKTFPRLAESVRPFIDSWVVCDTGSTDGTQGAVRTALHGIPGHVRDDLWTDFGTNRTAMLEMARGKADYLLLMDADWTLNVEGDALDHLGEFDCYMVKGAGGSSNLTHKVLIRGDMPWKAVGPVHEYVDCEDMFTWGELPGVTWTHHGDGGARHGRHVQDEAVLRDELAATARTTFYLAQTLRESGRATEAADMYLHRARLGGWDQEVCVSLYHAGIIRDDIGLLMQAWARCPDRLESLYEVAWRLRERGCHDAVLRLLRSSAEADALVVPEGLFVERWVYEWGVRFEYALALHNTGREDLARGVYEDLLSVVPDHIRPSVDGNLAQICGRLAA